MQIFQTYRRCASPVAAGLLVFMLLSCSTKKNSFVNRAFHNLTARDNGYFNAKLKIKDGEKRLSDAFPDKYDRILSVFKYPDDDRAKGVASVMDEAIKKSSVVVQRHSMLINGVEYCKWIDDNYIIIGKGQFYKRDFYSAIETFQYVTAQYKDKDSRYVALLWLMKIYMEQKNWDDTENIMDYLNGEPKVPKELRGELAATNASYYLQKKNYEKAITELNKAVKLADRRVDKTRYMFILAQVYQKEGDCKKAFDFYGKVIKRNPVYEMAFNAKINRARCFDSHNGKSDAVKVELMKMLKDEKNKEYLDQIYYALGTIALQDKDEPTAILYFNKSIRASTVNANQKALSYLELGNMYFAKPEYRKAQAYYDSTISSLSKDHPDYDDILLKRNSLNKLVKYIKTIELEDSLQKLALMSPQERDATIEAMIKKLKEEDERKKREEEEKKLLNSQLPTNTNSNPGNPATGGSWYFYNVSAISFGYSDFVKRWGNRANEDNWRRSNKEPVFQDNTAASDSAGGGAPGDTSKSKTAGKYDKQKYYRNIPLGPKQMEKSNLKIIDAYYNIALIYKEQIQDLKEACKTAEELLKRYPDNQYKLPMYYSLYLNYTALGNTERANYYRDLLLNNYPDSEYAMIIKDPDYLKNSQSRLNVLQEYYKQTYELFMKGQYEEVARRKEEADKRFPGNKLVPKFDYLMALITGKTKGLEQYTVALKGLITKYPNDEVKAKAQETLDFIAQMKDHDYAGKPAEVEKEIYRFVADTVHYFAVAFPVQVDANKIKGRLQDYSKKSYGESPFEYSIFVIDNKTQGVLVKSFTDKDAAQDYLYGLKNDKSIFAGTDVVQFVITPSNLEMLGKDKDIAKYMIFYRLNYPDVAHF